MYFVRRFFELCEFLLKTFHLSRTPVLCTLLRPTGVASSALLYPGVLRAHPPHSSQGRPPVCIVTSPCSCSDSGQLPPLAASAPPRPGCPLCTRPSYCAPAPTPRWAAPHAPAGMPFLFFRLSGCYRFAQTLALGVRPHSFRLSLPSSFLGR